MTDATPAPRPPFEPEPCPTRSPRLADGTRATRGRERWNAYLAGWRGYAPPREGYETRTAFRSGMARRIAAMKLGLWVPGCGRPWSPEEEAALIAAGIKKPRRARG